MVYSNFLLFLPTHANPGLKAVLSYYSSTITLNAEGDTAISEETLEGLGNSQFPDQKSIFLINLSTLLFGAILKIAEPPSKTTNSELSTDLPQSTYAPTSSNSTADAMDHVHAHFIEGTRDGVSIDVTDYLSPAEKVSIVENVTTHKKKSLLTEVLPDPGYFAAGAVAGIVSRTSTAPLDRLKVYLIASVGDAKGPIDAVKKGDVVVAVRHLGQPLIAASKDLWKNGGIRNLFAGKVRSSQIQILSLTPTGNGLNVMKVMPESAIKFGSYEAAKRFLAQLEGHGDPQKINPYSKFVAGGAGGVISQ